MNAATDLPCSQVDSLLALAANRLPATTMPAFEVFAREYFRQVDSADLAERTPADLLGALLAHQELGAQRPSAKAVVRVCSPVATQDGWGSRHSVVQIVNDDMPFLVDTVTMEINRQGLMLHLIVHPVLAVRRDASGALLSALPLAQAPDAPRESWMHVEFDRLLDPDQRGALTAGIERVLGDVRAVVQDWPAMLNRMKQAEAELAVAPANLPRAQVDESCAFLKWLEEGRITLLGYRQHDLVDEAGEAALQVVPGSSLGVLREVDLERLSASFAAVPAARRALARSPLPLLVVTKANTRSTVHRAGYTDYVGVKRYDGNGSVIGEHRFIGLFTSSAYSARVLETPLLRGKVEAIAARAGFAPGGHMAKALDHVLETFPRDGLFQIIDDELYEIALGIVSLGERQRLRLFLWRDPFDRFISCLVYAPREAYSTDLRIKFQRILLAAFDGSSADFDVALGETMLARIHFNVRTHPGKVPAFDRAAIEQQLALAARRWDDELRDALIGANGEAQGLALFRRWGVAFPGAYRERVGARSAVPDVQRLAGLSPQEPLALWLYRPEGAGAGEVGLKVYRLGAPLVLSDSLPMLEHMGVRVLAESNFQIGGLAGADGAIAMHDFALQAPLADDSDPEAVARLFEDAFARVFRGEVESDDFNRLVLLAGLAADEIVVLRAYAKYLKQIGFAQSQATISATLAAHPRMARMLVKLFKLRFDPEHRDEQGAAAQVNALEAALEKVSNLSEDRVLRQLLALVQATLRTNFWRTGLGASGAAGLRRSYLSLKFDSAAVPGLPQPRPLYEIFVYCPRFEGIHLRGGKVARGGLRWSDRPDDFRTEVLGLVKAQMVKNTVIVPVGSKGGFVLKKAPPAANREAFMAEGVACYQDYLRGLLDLTDNLVDGKPVPPPQVVRLDGDDPYLVVAADKGTATFSDFANAVSLEYGHWLGDAFASGGSVGYDHKVMGITARGAWESVKRHFRELDVNTQTTAFTVVGIGDMSGDVFGNGMLLSGQIHLLAAFDHRHVFIDPSPDAAASFAERERLFALPRSSWADFKSEIISAGGGVWARSEKSIPVSPQARAALAITADSLTPTELVCTILKAPVDLLYNGGIGTYVKARTEANADVGDRANDALRINGSELRCKVVAEGGNLGFTQRGRIEAALAGVRLYTDAIDNSAGVDTSDHEVNIKILLGLAVADGTLTPAGRNEVLPRMTDDVAALVLRDNYFQTQALSIGRRLAHEQLDEQGRFIRFLEKIGRLNRKIEFLPSDDELTERKARGLGLTTPEQAVLLAYSKMWLSDELVASDLPENAWVGQMLERYFPALLRGEYGRYIQHHPLRREIIATYLLNSMINRVGPTFIHRLGEVSGAAPPQIVCAYLAAREVFDAVDVWHRIEALDNQVADSLQCELIIEWRNLVARATAWFLRSRRLDDPMAQIVGRFGPAVRSLRNRLEPLAAEAARVVAWKQGGVPPDLAQQVGTADRLFTALDVAEIAEASDSGMDDATDVHVGIGERLRLDKLRQLIAQLPSDGHWDSLARLALADELADLQRSIARDAMARLRGPAPEILAEWERHNADAFGRASRLLAELGDAPAADLAMLSVALRELRNLL